MTIETKTHFGPVNLNVQEYEQLKTYTVAKQTNVAFFAKTLKGDEARCLHARMFIGANGVDEGNTSMSSKCFNFSHWFYTYLNLANNNEHFVIYDLFRQVILCNNAALANDLPQIHDAAAKECHFFHVAGGQEQLNTELAKTLALMLKN